MRWIRNAIVMVWCVICCALRLWHDPLSMLSLLADWIEEMQVGAELPVDTFVFLSRKGRNQPVSRVQAWRILRKARWRGSARNR